MFVCVGCVFALGLQTRINGCEQTPGDLAGDRVYTLNKKISAVSDTSSLYSHSCKSPLINGCVCVWLVLYTFTFTLVFGPYDDHFTYKPCIGICAPRKRCRFVAWRWETFWLYPGGRYGRIIVHVFERRMWEKEDGKVERREFGPFLRGSSSRLHQSFG